MFWTGSRTAETIVLELFFDGLSVGDSFWIEALASCAGFFNRLDVLGLRLLLWVIEGLAQFALVDGGVSRVEWFEVTCVDSLLY